MHSLRRASCLAFIVFAASAAAGEHEPNDFAPLATVLAGNSVAVRANIFPAGDVDFFAFTAQAGDYVSAFTQTASAAGSTDTRLTLYGIDGNTVLASNDDNGGFEHNASSLASAALPDSGTYFVVVAGHSPSTTVRPYDLYVQVRHGTMPVASPTSPQPFPGTGWVLGEMDPGFSDEFELSGSAGDTVFVSTNLDPFRDRVSESTTRFALRWPGGLAQVMDPPVPYRAPPGSLGMAVTLARTGSYTLAFDNGEGPYLAMVGRKPVRDLSSCTTYTATTIAALPTDGARQVLVPLDVDAEWIVDSASVRVKWGPGFGTPVEADLKMGVVSPQGTKVVLFEALAGNTGAAHDLTFSEDAAHPIGFGANVTDLVYQPHPSARLHWLEGQRADGQWNLVIDNITPGSTSGGQLTEWALTLCRRAPPPSCATGFVPVTRFATDFENDDGAFTHAGTLDSWEHGTPSSHVVSGCHSGAFCWKTNLTGDYADSSAQDLFSPVIDLAGLSPPITVEWWQRHRLEDATYDHASVDAKVVGGARSQRLFEFMDPTPITVTGWAQHRGAVDALVGEEIELVFHLDSDTSSTADGLVIDDVRVTGCVQSVSGSPDGGPSLDPGPGSTELPSRLTSSLGCASADASASPGALALLMLAVAALRRRRR